MADIISCLRYEHDYGLVLLALAICAGTAVLAFYVHDIARLASGHRKACWIAFTGVIAGGGIWATHFIAMLAFTPNLLMPSYDPGLTFASLLIAVLFTTAGFWTASQQSLWLAVVGGLIVGLGIGGMHYSGMAAVKFAGTLTWRADLVVASVVIGSILAALGVAAKAWAVGRQWWVAPALFTAAVCGLHFTGMGAVIMTPDPTVDVGGVQLDRSLLAGAVTIVIALVMLMGLIAVMLHREGEKEAATLRHLAQHDCLTGLPNRTALKQCIATLIAEKRREPSKFAVMFIDLDGFKQVNDRHGHIAGDALLRCVSDRLSSLSNANGGFVGRTGGDEFLIIQDEPQQPYAAQELGERLIRSFLKPLVFDDRLVPIGLSIGVAIFPDDGETADTLLSRADWALYRAKEEGRRCVVCQAPPSGAAFKSAPRTEPSALTA